MARVAEAAARESRAREKIEPELFSRRILNFVLDAFPQVRMSRPVVRSTGGRQGAQEARAAHRARFGAKIRFSTLAWAARASQSA